MGTLAFSSPEQLEAGKVDGRSDIYSLGATLWYAITAGVPFALRSRDQLLKLLADTPLPVALLVEREFPNPLSGCSSRCSHLPRRIGRVRPSIVTGITALSRRSEWPLIAEECAVAWPCALVGVAGGMGLAAGHRRVGPLSGCSICRTNPLPCLPFRNLSSDPANAFFAEGVQDDILSRWLDPGWKVISRLGSIELSGGCSTRLARIGRTLGCPASPRRQPASLGRLGCAFMSRAYRLPRWTRGLGLKATIANSADAINLQERTQPVISLMHSMRLSVRRERRDVRFQSTRATPTPMCCFLQDANSRKTPLLRSLPMRRPKRSTVRPWIVDPGFALLTRAVAITHGLLYRFRGTKRGTESSCSTLKPR